MKAYEQEKNFWKYEEDVLPEYDIYDHDIVDSGLSRATFLSTLRHLDLKEYLDIEGILLKEDERKELDKKASTISKVLGANRVLKPDVRYRVFVTGNIWKLHELILKEENIEKINIGTTVYIDEAYSLHVLDFKVPVKLKNDAPNEHYILTHMMKKGFEKECFYSDLNKEKILGDEKPWRTYYDACKNLNDKVDKQTEGKVKQLLLITSGETGSARLNPKYL